MNNILASGILLCFSVWTIFSIYLFAGANGTLDRFGSIVDSGVFPDGTPLIPITTNGRYPGLDWQIRAPTVFMWSFGDGNNLDTSLIGIMFAGSWAASWILIVLESLRQCNRWRFISFISIWGIFQFNHSHALITPLWLAVHLLTSPSARTPTIKGISIDSSHLLTLPASFILGFIIPLVPVALPFRIISVQLKQTAMGWYQQWPLFIAVPQLLLAAVLRLTPIPASFTTHNAQLKLHRTVYRFAFALAVGSFLPIVLISGLAALMPSLFTPSQALLLHPRHLLLPPNPFVAIKADSLAHGVFWLIQWDYLGGNCSHAFWAWVVYLRAVSVSKSADYKALKLSSLGKYFLLGGPIGVAVGLMWERDKIVLFEKATRQEQQPLLEQTS